MLLLLLLSYQVQCGLNEEEKEETMEKGENEEVKTHLKNDRDFFGINAILSPPLNFLIH